MSSTGVLATRVSELQGPAGESLRIQLTAVWGPWQVGNLTAKEYALKARQWAHGIKLVDPSVILISSGETGWADWDREVLQHLVPYIDMHSLHFYSTLFHEIYTKPGNDYEKNVFGPAGPEKGIEITKALIDQVNIDNTWRGVAGKDVKICYDEWNVWDQTKAGVNGGLEQIYDYTDMLGTIAWLNMLVRKVSLRSQERRSQADIQSKDIGIACIAQSCNVIAPILTKNNAILKQCTFYPLQLFSNFMRDGYLLATPSMPDYYDGETYPKFIQHVKTNPRYIDLVAIVKDSEDGKKSIRVSVMNRHPELDWDATAIEFNGIEVAKVTVHEMYSDDLTAANSWEKPETLVPTVTEYSAKEWAERKHVVRKHSWQFIIADSA